MKKPIMLFCTFLLFGTIAANAENLSMQECDMYVEAPQVFGCAAPTPAPCDTGDEVTCKMPICNLCGCECDCPCFKYTKEDIYKKLCLSQCQIEKANALYEKYKCDTQCIRDSLKSEEDKLCCLKQNCAQKCEIQDQKKKIENLQKTLKCFCKDLEKNFICILSTDQQSCYKKLKQEQKKNCKCKKNKCPIK